MRAKCRRSEAQTEKLMGWHRWFAWYPVRVPRWGRSSGMTTMWLCWVWRRATRLPRRGDVCTWPDFWNWEYELY